MGRKMIDPTGTVTLTCYLTRGQAAWIRKRGHLQGRSTSYVIRSIMEHHMAIDAALLELEKKDRTRDRR